MGLYLEILGAQQEEGVQGRRRRGSGFVKKLRRGKRRGPGRGRTLSQEGGRPDWRMAFFSKLFIEVKHGTESTQTIIV